MKKELKIFFTALMFFTRIPGPQWVGFSDENLEKSTKYFPLIGMIVGTIAAFVYCISQLFLPGSISIVLSLSAGILTTGAFHEDGLADVCDGFGGGWSKEKILEIMKDSRIGTYGVVGLALVLLSKYVLSVELSQISEIYFISVIILGHTLSRLNATSVILVYQYTRDDSTSKTKPLAKTLTMANYLVAFFYWNSATHFNFFHLELLYFYYCTSINLTHGLFGQLLQKMDRGIYRGLSWSCTAIE